MFKFFLLVLILFVSSNCMIVPRSCGCRAMFSNCVCEYITSFCDQSIDYTPVPGTCDHFYTCKFSMRFVSMCDAGFLFDSANRACKPAQEVKCEIDNMESISDQFIDFNDKNID